TIGQHDLSDLVKIKGRSGCEEIEISNRSLGTLLDMIIGPNKVEEFSALLQGLSSLFYPTDEFRHSVELVRNPLYYYFQREWRILSGVVLEGIEIDLPLTREEKDMVVCGNERFFNEIISLRYRQVRRIDACTIIRAIGDRPIRDFI